MNERRVQQLIEQAVSITVKNATDTVPIRVYERKRRKGNKVVHADDETGPINSPAIADLDK